MFTSKIVAAAAILATSALAVPAANPNLSGPIPVRRVDGDSDNAIAKRGNGIHLVNCVTYSGVVYCANDSNCNFFPSNSNWCLPSGPKNTAGLQIWEGQTESCTFSSNVQYTWNIESNAQSQALYSVVGGGNNGFQQFTIHKDDQHTMFVDGNGHACKSVYYCI
ncbi:hypothetical protein BX600DRAFT_493600, partial [Xylariales sp. PMI_506]